MTWLISSEKLTTPRLITNPDEQHPTTPRRGTTKMDPMIVDSNYSQRRRPLMDASGRVNHSKSPNAETPRLVVEESEVKSPDRMSFLMTPTPKRTRDVDRLSVATDMQPDSARNSIMSATSILSSRGKRKTHVGPWQLGRTLGKGATGRVRKAKHAVTGNTAAIKIVSKKSAAMVQSESIAAMDRNAGNFAGNFASKTTTRAMPCGIEREVVIMKLIEHPNVISLYDVWENRGELYLVLEYVEGGELFDYVSSNGPLQEEEAVRLFRQIIAALGYCHRFNICHRDLKPENILLDANHNVKLADFGMAALQPAGHMLNTSCGSPHYAAPEIIHGHSYRGDRADMWSCGIILYALLTGYLPFDGGDLAGTLRLVKKGVYNIPGNLSEEASDLIQRILQKRPEDRITMQHIWMHPLLTKYEKLHNALVDHYVGPPPPLSVKDCGPALSCYQDIDIDILRNLQTLWHDVELNDLIQRLLCIEPTHERLFYNALARFRDDQLENYQGQPLEYSASDYHHISRPGQVRRGRSQTGQGSSKRRAQYSSGKDLCHRSSSIKEPMSCGTVESYDPYRSPKHEKMMQTQYAQITVHREAGNNTVDLLSSPRVQPPPSIVEEEEPEDDEDEDDDLTDSPFTVVQKRKHRPSSMKSFHSSRMPHSSSRAPGLSTHSMSYRRNVSFHHTRNRSQGSTTAKPKRRKTATPNHQTEIKRSPSTCSLQILAECTGPQEIPSSPPLPAQPMVVRPNNPKVRSLHHVRKVRDSDYTWKEDTRQVSHELSQICEEAFNGSSASTMRTASVGSGYETPGTPLSMASPPQVQPTAIPAAPKPPKEPTPSQNIRALIQTRQRVLEYSCGRTNNVLHNLPEVISQLDRLIDEHRAIAQREIDVGTFSDPFITTPAEASLPVIDEETASPALSSREMATQPQPPPRASLAVSQGADPRATIRMVPHSSFRSMEEVKPLTIRKKKSMKPVPDVQEGATVVSEPADRDVSSEVRRNTPHSLAPIEEAPVSPKKACPAGSQGKKWSWFKHRSNISEAPSTPPTPPAKDPTPLVYAGDNSVNKPVTLVSEFAPSPVKNERVPTRKTSLDRFGGSFLKKLMKKPNKSAPEPATEPEPEPQTTSSKDHRHSFMCQGLADTDSSVEGDDPRNLFLNKRRSVANQNWFARVFQIKPATQVIPLSISKAKGRKELYRLLREWQDFGMEDVYLDKTNSIVHGRVGEANVLSLREVEFTAEFYTVLEHGRQANLSLVRFKQERGAASSFNKVVETVHTTLQRRGIVVEDPSKAKKMSRVLDSIPKHK
ncbi:unnamed protein product [Penicillium olsonii]|nr:unnamed protein product [Penicillium olsonii]